MMYGRGFKKLVVHTIKPHPLKFRNIQITHHTSTEPNFPQQGRIDLYYTDKKIQKFIFEQADIDEVMDNPNYGITYQNGKILQPQQTSSVMLNSESQVPEITAPLPPPKQIDYLQRLLGSWPKLFGSKFTEALGNNLQILHQLKLNQHDIVGINTEEKNLTQEITSQASTCRTAKESRKLRSTVSETANFLENNVLALNQNPKPQQSDIENLQTQLQDYHNKSLLKAYKETIQPLVDRTIANATKKIKVDNDLAQIRENMAETLKTYIEEYANVSTTGSVMSVTFKQKTSDMHKAKVNVMLAMNNFLQNPTQQTWTALQTAKTINPGWDKGSFSRVSTRMNEVEKFYKTGQEEDIGVFPKAPTQGK